MSGVHSLKVLADEPGRDPLEAAFLRAIAEDPDDDATRAAYADWLEEEGKEKQALYLRLDLERSRTRRTETRFAEVGCMMAALKEDVAPAWVEGLKRPARILNCGKAAALDPYFRVRFLCPNRWSDLTDTKQPEVRHCGDCRRTVTLCHDVEEAKRLGRIGSCIALSSRVALEVVPALEDDDGLIDDEMLLGEIEYVDDGGITPFVAPPPPTPEPKKPWWQFW